MAVWSEVKTSKVIFSKRIDAERYKPQYVNNEAMLSKIKSKPLKLFISDITGGATPLGANYPSSGIPFMRVQNIRENYWNLSDFVYISESVHNNQLHRSQLKNQDVLLTITGMSYGNSCVAWQEILPANMNQHSVRISLNKNLLPGFLSTFFISKFGRFQSDSKVTGDTRPALTYSEIDKYLIPEIDVCYQNEVHNIVRESFEKQMQSQFLYTQAQQLLEQELGLDKLTFEKPVGYEARFSEVMEGRRIDSQCYSPEHINYEKYLRANSEFELLRNVLSSTLKGKQMVALDDGNLKYASIKDIQGLELVSDSYCSPAPDTRIAGKDTLLLAITGATIGKVGIVNRYDSLAFSGDLLGLITKDTVSPHYLLAVLQSPIGQSQCFRWITGSTNGHLSPNDVGKIVIPRLKEKSEQKISDFIVGALSARKESEALLEQAKSRVESLIEEVAAK